MKNIILTSIAAFSVIMFSAQAEGMKCQAKKCGSGMNKHIKKSKKIHKKRESSPFLIKRGLPHLTKMLMKSWDDPKLALTHEQKEKLLEVRKTTMNGIMRLKPEIMKLKREIIRESHHGSKAAALKDKVEKLASFEAGATMIHLDCLEKTKNILSKPQYKYLMQKYGKHHI